MPVSPQPAFANEWILEPFEAQPRYFTKPMFGGLAAYVFGRQMLLLVQPTKSGRWTWHGVLICTSHEQQPSIRKQFPALKPHHVLKKWLFIDSMHRDFERTMLGVAACVARDDERFGVAPRARGTKKRRVK